MRRRGQEKAAMTDFIMDIKGVNVSFDGFKVLDNLDFSIKYGELRFLIGPNGAGKSTLLDIMTAKTRADKGKVTFDKHINVGRKSEHQLVREGIGRKFQTPSVFASLSVFENLEAAIGFKTNVFKLGSKLSGEQVSKIEETLETINLKDQRDLSAGILSHGQKQWLEIGMLLVQEPKLMLLDEPVAGMTRKERDHTGELLHRIANNRSILVVEHDMVFVRQFATTVTVLHMGKLLCEGPVEEVQADPHVIEVYLGRGHRPAA
jgi:urea transport system ATP-binding protein